ncbi:uncharacterized protein si:dkey-31c13.1 isoform X1 [Amphiprion ocellaris]|uniref:uncharacterized protein si:dkey-31c13.1 isoform X1 n=1 Tax=Amphiprion ocellaris TaxID=80972 RepID=UPI000C31AE69|nr:uncharacterized protein si:dkey-31c13.1 isoform X1 [Amphiprion ocellaris]
MTQFDNSADLDSFIKGVEEESQTKFITFSVDRNYNDKDWQPLPGNRVYWQWAGGSGMPAIEFTGIPFMFMGFKRLVCHRGKDLAVAQKQKYAEEKAKKMMLDHNFGSQRLLRQVTKKVGCPAAISISKIATFPKFKVDENKERSRKTASKMLRTALERDPIIWKTCYTVTKPSAHSGHAVGEAAIKESSHNKRLTNKNTQTTDCDFPRHKRARKMELRNKCVNLTQLIMEKIYVTEDQHILEELSEKLSILLKEFTPPTSSEDEMPLHLEEKRVKISSVIPTPLSQRSPKSRYTDRVGAHADSMWGAHTVPGPFYTVKFL